MLDLFSKTNTATSFLWSYISTSFKIHIIICSKMVYIDIIWSKILLVIIYIDG